MTDPTQPEAPVNDATEDRASDEPRANAEAPVNDATENGASDEPRVNAEARLNDATEDGAREPGASAESASPELTAIVESLLFLSPEPVKLSDLAEATDAEPPQIEEALAQLQRSGGGLVLREIGGGWTLASIPEADKAARRLLAKPRTPPLTQAQAETLAIVAYLQPVSRPEIARIRGVSSESATEIGRAHV